MAPFDASPTWNQITIVGNGTTDVSTYYINGVAVGSANEVSPNGIVTIGNLFGGTQTFAAIPQQRLYLQHASDGDAGHAALRRHGRHADPDVDTVADRLPRHDRHGRISGPQRQQPDRALPRQHQRKRRHGHQQRVGHYVDLDARPDERLNHLRRQYPGRQRPGRSDHQRQRRRHADPHRHRQYLQRRHHDHQRLPATWNQQRTPQ